MHDKQLTQYHTMSSKAPSPVVPPILHPGVKNAHIGGQRYVLRCDSSPVRDFRSAFYRHADGPHALRASDLPNSVTSQKLITTVGQTSDNTAHVPTDERASSQADREDYETLCKQWNQISLAITQQHESTAVLHTPPNVMQLTLLHDLCTDLRPGGVPIDGWARISSAGLDMPCV